MWAKAMNFLSSPPPSDEDSKDITEVEVSHAVITTSEDEFKRMLVQELSPGMASISKQDARYASRSYELHRKKPHLYCRVRLGCPGEPDKVLVYQVDWIQTQATE